MRPPRFLLIGCLAASFGSTALGQPPRGAGILPPPAPGPLPPAPAGPMYQEPAGFDTFQRPYRLQDLSFIYVEPPPPREIKVHDIVTIIVNEKSQVTMNSIFNRQKNATYNAQLKEFIRIGDSGNLRPAALDQPAINGNLQSRLQSTGQMNDTEGINFRIAAEVVDVQPNGILVLEARKTARSNREYWEYTLTGRVRSEDVNRDNTVLSEDIANQAVTKRMKGKVYDSTNRPWGTRLWDKFFPF